LDAAILSYLDAHPNAVDSPAGIVTWWLLRTPRDSSRVERALERLAERNLIERIRLADGTLVYGRSTERPRQ
jgi:DNA-binding MarR family transcriptional regulator